MAEADILSQIETAFPGKIQEQHSLHRNATIVIDRADALEILGELKRNADFSFNLLVDLTAADFFGKDMDGSISPPGAVNISSRPTCATALRNSKGKRMASF